MLVNVYNYIWHDQVLKGRKGQVIIIINYVVLFLQSSKLVETFLYTYHQTENYHN